jgi:hypothetical protein
VKWLAAIALAALACATRPAPVDPGALQGSVYRNDALDLVVTAPPGWAFAMRGEPAADTPAGRPKRGKSRAKETPLFTLVDGASPPAPGRARRSLSARAETVPDAPAGATSEIFADALADALQNDDSTIALRERRQAMVGDRRFTVVATEMERGGVRARVDHYVRFESGRVLVLTFSYPPEQSGPPPAVVAAIGRSAPAPLKGAP